MRADAIPVAPRFRSGWQIAALGFLLAGSVALVSLAFGIARLPLPLVLDLRLPRAVAGLCAGAALGTAGCLLQALLRNPLASPAVIGSAQGATFGALFAIALGAGRIGTLASSSVLAVVAVLAVLALSRGRRAAPAESVVLHGMALALFFLALARLTLALTTDEYALGRMSVWLTGGLWHSSWNALQVFGPMTLLVVIASAALARPLDLLALGESDARRLGMPVERIGTAVVVLSGVLTGLAICLGGMIAFVGLLVPHACRRLVGMRHAVLVPASASLGGMLVVLADTVARTAVPPQELPLTVVTSLIGVPAFLVLLRTLQRGRLA